MSYIKKITILFGAAILFFNACNSSSKAKVEGTFAGYPDDTLDFYRLNLSELVKVDSVVTNSQGGFKVRLETKSGFPEFYYVMNREKTLSSLLVLPGDRISITADSLQRIQNVTGSDETRFLHEVESGMAKARHQFDSLMRLFVALDSNTPEAIELNYALGELYVKQKQAAIKFIFTHPRSMASVQLMFQSFSDDLPLFADVNDALYFQRLYDSLQPLYPRSPYIAALRDQSEWRRKEMEINDILLNVQERGFPDLVIPDVQAKPVALSEFHGKVVILSFWLSQDPGHRMVNHELLELYRVYAPKGLEIYQVALDTDKTAWARAIADQALPWISVCDGFGAGSTAVSAYAVTQVPTSFIIDRNGDILGRDFSMEQLKVEVARLCR
ncbi:MAG: AhpC/TSA family protein [Bacteroidales bacterium]|nr:AhpC/TSA family protein [Bacteroidales bacterium]